jgi:cobalt-zinc-cadmium efflux system outer membrane protein
MYSHSSLGVGGAVLWFCSSLFVPAWAAPIDGPSAGPLSPEDAVHAALQVHPAVLGAQSDLSYARGTRAESWMFNPQVSASFDAARALVEFQQPLSVTGAGWHARRSASSSIDAAQARLQRARLVAAANTRAAYVQAVVAVGNVRVAKDGVELAARLRSAVSRQYEEGEASLLDLRLARLSEVNAASGLMEARHNEILALRALVGLVARDVAGHDLVNDPLLLSMRGVNETVSERSDVLAAASELQAAKSDFRAQQAAAVPPVTLGAFVEVEDGRRLVGPSIAVQLPLVQRNQGNRGMARGQVRVAEAKVKSVQALATAEQRTARAWVAEADALSGVIVQDPIDEARAALKSIEAGYLAGELDLSSTVLLQAEVLRGEAAAIELRGRVAVARLDWMLSREDVGLLRGAQ